MDTSEDTGVVASTQQQNFTQKIGWEGRGNKSRTSGFVSASGAFSGT